jgi:hypothetical protein
MLTPVRRTAAARVVADHHSISIPSGCRGSSNAVVPAGVDGPKVRAWIAWRLLAGKKCRDSRRCLLAGVLFDQSLFGSTADVDPGACRTH